MSGARHTPGPWRVVNGRGSDGGIAVTIVGASGGVVALCKARNGRKEASAREANARLIASAPELLAALQDAVDILDDIAPHDHVIEALKAARAAHAKATQP